MQIDKTKIATVQKYNKKEVEKENKEKEQKPQLKEHCSSNAGKALKGIAIGLALAAGVAVSSKGMVVQAAKENTPSPENNTSISQQIEENTQKSDVEMMVDELMEKSTYSDIHISGKTACKGEMRDSRNYEQAEITSDGKLIFTDKETSMEYKTGYQLNYNGKFEYCTKVKDETNYITQNSFNLGAEVNKSTIKLQPGTQFNEEVQKNGDYVELAEDGKTFNVYDSSGKQIGYCEFMTDKEYAEAKEVAAETAKVAGVVIGSAAAVTGGVGAIAIHKKNKIS